MSNGRPRVDGAGADVAILGGALRGIRGRGYLEVLTTGYRRAEGVFFAAISEHERLVQLLIEGQPVSFEGPLFGAEGKEFVEVRVVLRAVRVEGGQTRAEIVKTGSA